MIEVKLEGFAELERELDRISKAAGKGVLRRSLKKSAEPLAKTAGSMAPVGRTGKLASSFHYGTKLNKRQAGLHRKMFANDRAAVEGFVGTNNPAGIQQEFGNVNHPPQPSLRPAWDAGKNKVLDDLGRLLWEELDKSILRAERKAARGK